MSFRGAIRDGIGRLVSLHKLWQPFKGINELRENMETIIEAQETI